MRLTEAQKFVLAALSERPQSFWENYPPIKKLTGAGLIEKVEGARSDFFNLTEKGRQMWQELNAKGC